MTSNLPLSQWPTLSRNSSPQSEFVSFRNLAPDIPSTTYATFGLYRYPAKFIPQVVSYTLRRYGAAGESVIDPFAGYGTVGTVARTQNNPYELWDLNPLMPTLHQLSIMQPPNVEPDALVRDLKSACWRVPACMAQPRLLAPPKFLADVGAGMELLPQSPRRRSQERATGPSAQGDSAIFFQRRETPEALPIAPCHGGVLTSCWSRIGGRTSTACSAMA